MIKFTTLTSETNRNGSRRAFLPLSSECKYIQYTPAFLRDFVIILKNKFVN